MNRKFKVTRSFSLGLLLCLFVWTAPPTLRAQNSGFVYVANTAPAFGGPSPSILGFSITDNNGALTPVPGSPFHIPSGGSALAVTPSGRFLYTPAPAYDSSTGIYSISFAGYAIDANSGSLTPLPGSPFFAAAEGLFGPAVLTMDPSGKFLYAMLYYYNQIFVYSIDQNTGALTLTADSPFQTQRAYPTVFALDATGQFAYVAYQAFRSDGSDITAYRIDPTSGSFTLVPGSPFTVPYDPSSAIKREPSITWAATHPAGFLYLSDIDQSDLWTFSIDPSSGALTLLPSSPMHFPEGANLFTIDPGGNFAYFTTNFPNPAVCGNYYPFTNVHAPSSVFVYSIDQTSGALSPAKTPVLTAGYQPNPVATDPSGTYVYVVNLQGYNFDPNSSTISAYRSRGIGGPVTEVLGSPFTAGAHAATTLVVAAPQKKN